MAAAGFIYSVLLPKNVLESSNGRFCLGGQLEGPRRWVVSEKEGHWAVNEDGCQVWVRVSLGEG
jgi:hypothetical protein